jgi:hypothetical protein
MFKTTNTLAIAVSLSFLVVAQAQATLILTIDNYTLDEVSFTISGTFDADTIGNNPGYLAVKNDWSNNTGSHTEWFSSTPSISSNTILFGGVASGNTIVQGAGDSWNDAIMFLPPNGMSDTVFLAGTEVSGSVTLTGAGQFDPTDLATLQLLSGFDGTDWVRHEATALVPEPSTALLLCLGLPALTTGRWNR